MKKALNGLVKQPEWVHLLQLALFYTMILKIQKTQRKTTEDMVKHNETTINMRTQHELQRCIWRSKRRKCLWHLDERFSYVANTMVLSWCNVDIDANSAYSYSIYLWHRIEKKFIHKICKYTRLCWFTYEVTVKYIFPPIELQRVPSHMKD